MLVAIRPISTPEDKQFHRRVYMADFGWVSQMTKHYVVFGWGEWNAMSIHKRI